MTTPRCILFVAEKIREGSTVARIPIAAYPCKGLIVLICSTDDLLSRHAKERTFRIAWQIEARAVSFTVLQEGFPCIRIFQDLNDGFFRLGITVSNRRL